LKSACGTPPTSSARIPASNPRKYSAPVLGLKTINAAARELEATIASNVTEILEA
jgi:hypothetical protein